MTGDNKSAYSLLRIWFYASNMQQIQPDCNFDAKFTHRKPKKKYSIKTKWVKNQEIYAFHTKV